MRFFFSIMLVSLVVFSISKFFQLLISGKLFEEGAVKESFRESGKTLWLGMRLFVVLWFAYLIIVWLATRH